MDDATRALLRVIAEEWPDSTTLEQACANQTESDRAILTERFGSATIQSLIDS